MIAKLRIVAALSLAALAWLSAGAISAHAFAKPGWEITSSTLPTNLKPAGGKGVLVLHPLNVGAASSSGPITVTDTLPPGVIAIEAGEIGQLHGLTVSEPSIGHTRWKCEIESINKGSEEERSLVTCHNTAQLPSITGGGGPGTPIEGQGQGHQPMIGIKVGVTSEAEGSLSNQMRVEGGGALNAISASSPLIISSEEPAFGLARWSGWFSNADGTLDTQAGSVPYTFTTTFDAANTLKLIEGKQEILAAGGELRDLAVQLPPGFVGNATAVPQCTRLQYDTQSCPKESVVGNLRIYTRNVSATLHVFNLVPPPGLPAQFAFAFESINSFIDPHVRTGADYGITADVENSPQKELLSAELTLWGVPSDPSHNQWRDVNDGGCTPAELAPGGFCSLGAHPSLRPFLTVPTSCGAPQPFSESANAWQAQLTSFTDPMSFITTGGEGVPSGFTDCGVLPFEPSISSASTTSTSDSPTGLDFDLHIPTHEQVAPQEEGGETVGAQPELASAHLKNAVVTLPPGLVINPSSANGLLACSPAQIGLTSAIGATPVRMTPDPATCPDQAKVGEVEVNTPLLAHPLKGGVYVAAPRENPFGSLLAIYIAVDDRQSGVVIKLAGHVEANEQTGQLTTRFEQNPQLPFEDFHLKFFGEANAALRTPSTCGTYTTSSQMTPWSSPEGAEAFPQSSFTIATGPGGGPCAQSEAQEPFAPSFNAGVLSSQAASFGALTVTFSRKDGEQGLSGVSVTTPPGLSGYIKNVPECPEPQASQGNCPDASLIGEASTSVGAGPAPYWVNGGKVYLTVPYKGAPYGLSILVPTTAGPYTLNGNGGLGREIVRASIRVDPLSAQITVASDPLPQILEGIPLDVRAVRVSINRPQFIISPSNCSPLSSSASFTSTQGAKASAQSPFYAAGCAALKFTPHFSVSTAAKTSKANGASLFTKISYPKEPQGSQANIAYAKVTLPKQLPSRLTTLQKACTAAQFEANPAGCPSASIVGHAIVHTPVLPVPLEGPAYFVSHGNEAFPNLTIVLQGYGVTVELVGSTQIKSGITTTTFKSAPDVPFETFELTLPEGPFSALTANANLCQSKLAMPIEYHAQNGTVLQQDPVIAVQGCPSALSLLSHKVKGKKLTLKVYVPAAGKLTVSGKGLSKASKKAPGREVLTLTVAQKHSGKLRTKVRLSFVPGKGRKLAGSVAVRFQGSH